MLLLLALAQTPDAAAMVAFARERLQPERCVYDSASTDITVCGLRHADRYRVPLVTARARSGAVLDNATLERASLVYRATPLEQLSPFLVGGGMVGVRAGVAFGPGTGAGKARVGGTRPLAP